jgi:DNA invertase Pin-like site-specific DNA recombinase
MNSPINIFTTNGGNKMKITKCAIYVRVSTDKQEVSNQLDQLKPYVVKSGWIIYEKYIDVISGKEQSRPGYDKMFRDAHQRLFDVVLFWDLSRFSRSGTLFTLQKLRELENLGIEWESYTEPYFRTAGKFKDVILSIMATLAKIERERISERTKAGLATAENVGKRGRDKKPRRRRSDRGIKRGYAQNGIK